MPTIAEQKATHRDWVMEGAANIAAIVAHYYNCLVAHGLSPDAALMLTLPYEEALLKVANTLKDGDAAWS